MGQHSTQTKSTDSHTTTITRIQHLLRELQERLPDEPAAGIKDRGGAPGRVAELVLDAVDHGADALGLGDVGGDADGVAAGAVDGVDDRGVGVRVPGEEGDRVGGGEFAGDGGAGLVRGGLVGGDGGGVGDVRLGRRRR